MRACMDCGGRGYDYNACSNCFGDQVQDCPHCYRGRTTDANGDRTDCPRCGGDWLITCQGCGGSGKGSRYTCSTCNGAGQLTFHAFRTIENRRAEDERNRAVLAAEAKRQRQRAFHEQNLPELSAARCEWDPLAVDAERLLGQIGSIDASRQEVREAYVCALDEVRAARGICARCGRPLPQGLPRASRLHREGRCVSAPPPRVRKAPFKRIKWRQIACAGAAVGTGLGALRWEYLASFVGLSAFILATAVIGTAIRAAKDCKRPGAYTVAFKVEKLTAVPNDAAARQLGGAIGSGAPVLCLWLFGVLLPFWKLEPEPGGRALAAQIGTVLLAAVSTYPVSKAWRVGLFPFRFGAKGLAKRLNASPGSLVPSSASKEARDLGFESNARAEICALVEQRHAREDEGSQEHLMAVLRVHEFDVEMFELFAKLRNVIGRELDLLGKRAKALEDKDLKSDVEFVKKQISPASLRPLLAGRDYLGAFQLLSVVRRDLDSIEVKSMGRFDASAG